MPSQAKPNTAIERILQFSLLLTFLYIVATFVFGVRAHSLALISEAGHNVSDFAALGLSFVAVWLGNRPANDRRTFGYQRAGVLAGFVNALSLLALALWIAVDAVMRLMRPVAVAPREMIFVALAGVVMNGLIAALLWRFSGDVNIRSVFVHMLGDTISTAAVIVGGVLIALTHRYWVDPLLSLIIAGMILWSSWGILRETLHILLEGTPASVKLDDLREAMRKVPGVRDVHDLHIWSLTSQSHALACHVRVAEMSMSQTEVLLERLRHEARDHFGIGHTTIQIEVTACEVTGDCCSPPERQLIDGHSHHHHHGHGPHSHGGHVHA